MEEVLYRDQDSIKLSINNLSKIDTIVLPDTVSSKITDSYNSAGSIFQKLDEVIEARNMLDEATKSYSKIHSEVRVLQREIRKIDKWTR